jgi:hypothetical protein
MTSMERKIFGAVATALLTIIFGAVVWLLLQPPEPVYHGKPIGYWINLPGNTSDALGYFPKADSKAIPYLVHALRARNGVVTKFYAGSWAKAPQWMQQHLPTPVTLDAAMVRANAAQALGRLGTNSPSAISGLMRVLKEDDVSYVRVFAAESLQDIGKGNELVAKSMIEALHDRAPEVRDAASDALWQIDPTAAKAQLK